MSAESSPQAKHHSSRLEETDLVVGLLGPAPTECFVERASAGQVVDSEGHETDALFHYVMITRGGTASQAEADERSPSRKLFRVAMFEPGYVACRGTRFSNQEEERRGRDGTIRSPARG